MRLPSVLRSLLWGLLLTGTLGLLLSCESGGTEAVPAADFTAAAESDSEAAPEPQTTIKEEHIMYSVWLSNGYEKYGKLAPAPAACAESISLAMAKNETESFQLLLRPDAGEPESTVSVAVDGCSDGLTAELYRVRSVETKKGRFDPDPLAPYDGAAADVPADETTAFFIRLRASADAASGDRELTVQLKNNAGSVIGSYPVSVHIRNFALPAASACASGVGLSKSNIGEMHYTFKESKRDELYRAYYDLLLDFRLCAYDLPYDILDERADVYMSDPRVTAFRIPDAVDDSVIRAYYEKLSQNPVWLGKGYFYPLDEPTSVEMLDTLKQKVERIRGLFPGARICTPFFRDIDYDGNTDQIDFMTGVTDQWCPKSYMYLDKNIYDAKKAAKYPSFENRMLARKAEGDRVWWYVCWEPGNPYCNLFLDQAGLQHRLLFWQQKYYGVDGFLYWSTNYWNDTLDPWEDMATVKSLSPDVFGDGSLLYNGKKVGLDTGCPSLRLAAVCDGIEDFDLLTLAEQYLGKERVREIIASVTPSLIDYTTDAAEFDRVRRMLGDELEAAIG